MYAIVQREFRRQYSSGASTDCEEKCDQFTSQEPKTDSKLRANNSKEIWHYDHLIHICTSEDSSSVTTAQRTQYVRADCTDQSVKTAEGNTYNYS